MGSQGVGESGQSQLHPLPQQNSMYNLTLDEVQNQRGKPLRSMNFQELLKSVCNAEGNHLMDVDNENTAVAHKPSVHQQRSLSTTGGISKKALEESSGEMIITEQQLTMGEVTLEDFLQMAGFDAEGSSERKNEESIAREEAAFPLRTSHQRQRLQYLPPQSQCPQQNLMNCYIQAQALPQQQMPMFESSVGVMDVSYPEDQVCYTSSSIGTSSDLQMSGTKIFSSNQNMVKTVERRQKRMIKNRESAARSRARKLAYTNELEHKVSRLEKENERLRKQQELEKILPCRPLPEPKCQLRRTSSSCF